MTPEQRGRLMDAIAGQQGCGLHQHRQIATSPRPTRLRLGVSRPAAFLSSPRGGVTPLPLPEGDEKIRAAAFSSQLRVTPPGTAPPSPQSCAFPREIGRASPQGARFGHDTGSPTPALLGVPAGRGEATRRAFFLSPDWRMSAPDKMDKTVDSEERAARSPSTAWPWSATARAAVAMPIACCPIPQGWPQICIAC